MLYRLDFECYRGEDAPGEPFHRFEIVVEAPAHRRGRIPTALVEHGRTVAAAWLRGVNAEAVEVRVEHATFRPVDLRPEHLACASTCALDEYRYTVEVLDRIERYPVAQRRAPGRTLTGSEGA